MPEFSEYMYDVLPASQSNVRFRALLYGTVQFLTLIPPDRLLINRILTAMARNLNQNWLCHKIQFLGVMNSEFNYI
jgi:hypothetical protein